MVIVSHCLHENRHKRYSQIKSGSSGSKGEGVDWSDSRESLSNTTQLRKIDWRSARVIFPPNQYTASLDLSGIRGRKNYQNYQLVDPLWTIIRPLSCAACQWPLSGEFFVFIHLQARGLKAAVLCPPKYKNRRSMPWKAGKKEDFGVFPKKGLTSREFYGIIAYVAWDAKF